MSITHLLKISRYVKFSANFFNNFLSECNLKKLTFFKPTSLQFRNSANYKNSTLKVHWLLFPIEQRDFQRLKYLKNMGGRGKPLTKGALLLSPTFSETYTNPTVSRLSFYEFSLLY